NLNEFKSLIETFMESLNHLFDELVLKFMKIDKKNKLMEHLNDKDFLEHIKNALFDETLNLEMSLKSKLQEIFQEKLKVEHEDKKSRVIPSKVVYASHFDEIKENLNRLESKLQEKIRLKFESMKKKSESIKNIINTFKKIDKISDFNEALPLLKEFTMSLYSKTSSYNYSQLKKAFNKNKINKSRVNEIFNKQLKSNLLEALIHDVLSNYGNLTLHSINSLIPIDPRRLFLSILALIEKGLIIQVGESMNEPLYSSQVSGNPLRKDLEKIKERLTILATRFTIIQNDIEELLAKIENIDNLLNDIDKVKTDLYEMEIKEILNSMDQLENLLPEEKKTNEELIFKINSMIEAYKMYRIPLIIEKDEILQSEIDDKEKLKNTFDTLLEQDYLKGKIINAIKIFGPLDIVQLEKHSKIPRSKLFIILNILRMNDEIQIKEHHAKYQLFDIPRKISAQQKFLYTFFDNLLKLFNLRNLILEKFNKLKENLFEINDLVSEINGSILEIQKLNLNDNMIFEDIIEDILEKIVNLNDKFLGLRSRVKIGKKTIDFSKLVPIKITKVDEEYASYIEPDEIIGFGTIESDEKKCISCGKCERVCPEGAAQLENTWDLSTLFEMNDEEIKLLPENRREMISLIKKMARKKPSKIILPKGILGFGKSTFDPIKCIACKECLEKCPNDAIMFEEIWNVPEIVRKLSIQKII
ncbi:MAG: 4Fe-4S binding protein, partial [Candidatus Helarchaeota archaeon]